MTYVPVGALAAKTVLATLTDPSVVAPADALFLAGLGYDDTLGAIDPVLAHPDSVSWGNRLLANRPAAATRNPGTFDVAMSVWMIPRVRGAGDKALEALWPAVITERAMAFGYVPGKNRIDQAAGANFAAATADPITDATAALAAADDVAVAYFVSEGPLNDAAGTMEILDGGVWTAVEGTQRDGTNGAPPVSNVTIQVGWLQLTSALATQARITGADARSWTCAILTVKEAADLRQGVTPTDMASVELLFEAEIPPLKPEDAAFVYSLDNDRYEAFDRNDMTTRIAFATPDGWVAG